MGKNEEIEKRVIDIIIEETKNTELSIDSDVDLIEEDIIDSLAFINVIERLNDEFGIEIQPTQVNPNVWRKVERIIELVVSLKQ